MNNRLPISPRCKRKKEPQKESPRTGSNWAGLITSWGKQPTYTKLNHHYTTRHAFLLIERRQQNDIPHFRMVLAVRELSAAILFVSSISNWTISADRIRYPGFHIIKRLCCSSANRRTVTNYMQVITVRHGTLLIGRSIRCRLRVGIRTELSGRLSSRTQSR